MTQVSVIMFKLHVATNTPLRRTGNEKVWEGEKLHIELNDDLYCLPNFGRVTKSRRMRWARHVARIGGGEERCMQGFGGEI